MQLICGFMQIIKRPDRKKIQTHDFITNIAKIILIVNIKCCIYLYYLLVYTFCVEQICIYCQYTCTVAHFFKSTLANPTSWIQAGSRGFRHSNLGIHSNKIAAGAPMQIGKSYQPDIKVQLLAALNSCHSLISLSYQFFLLLLFRTQNAIYSSSLNITVLPQKNYTGDLKKLHPISHYFFFSLLLNNTFLKIKKKFFLYQA